MSSSQPQNGENADNADNANNANTGSANGNENKAHFSHQGRMFGQLYGETINIIYGSSAQNSGAPCFGFNQ
jgi:hypothetical protein